MTFDEILKNIKEGLKANLTPENTEKIVALDKQLDDLASEHKGLQEKYTKQSETLIDYVKNTKFKALEGNDPIQPSSPKKEPSFEDMLNAALEEDAKNG